MPIIVITCQDEKLPQHQKEMQKAERRGKNFMDLESAHHRFENYWTKQCSGYGKRGNRGKARGETQMKFLDYAMGCSLLVLEKFGSRAAVCHQCHYFSRHSVCFSVGINNQRQKAECRDLKIDKQQAAGGKYNPSAGWKHKVESLVMIIPTS